MKITPRNLIESWNALMDTYRANSGLEFTTQAERLQMQLQNEVDFWNGLSLEKRKSIQEKPMTVQLDKITTVPAHYSNNDRAALQRFFEPTLPEKEIHMAQLIEDEPKNEEE